MTDGQVGRETGMADTPATALTIQADVIETLLPPIGDKPMIVTVRADRNANPQALLEFESVDTDEVPDPSVLPALAAMFGPLLLPRDAWRLSGLTLYYNPQHRCTDNIVLDVKDILDLIQNVATMPKLLEYIPGRRNSAKPSARINFALEGGEVQATCNLLNAKGEAATINEESFELYSALTELGRRLFSASTEALSLMALSLALDVQPATDATDGQAAEWLSSELCPNDLRVLVQNKFIGPFPDSALLAALERAKPGRNDDALLAAARERFAGLIGGSTPARATPSPTRKAAHAEPARADPTQDGAPLLGRLWKKLAR